MKSIPRISEKVYLVGSTKLSHPLDSNVYFIDGSPRECILIDSGCGLDLNKIIKNVESLGIDPFLISCVVNTHCHFRHAGGNSALKRFLGYCEVIIHELDADAVETGDVRLTKAADYECVFNPCVVDVRVFSEDDGSMRWRVSAGETDLIPIPVNIHTPGSMLLYGDFDDQGVLFSGDFHSSGSNSIKDVQFVEKLVPSLAESRIDTICAGHMIVKKSH